MAGCVYLAHVAHLDLKPILFVGFDEAHHLALEQRQHVGVVDDLLLDYRTVGIVAGSFEEKSANNTHT